MLFNEKNFDKSTCVFMHLFCSFGMHFAINMIKEMHLFESQKYHYKNFNTCTLIWFFEMVNIMQGV